MALFERVQMPSFAGATKEQAIDYPVAADNNYAIWSAFANEQSERVIQKLLGVERELLSVEGVGVEAAADWDHLYTPETYLGSTRSDQLPSSMRACLPDDTSLSAREL